MLGVFVPSGGSKWVLEAPYVMQAAHNLHVHLGWMVAVYDLGEALANLVQPFWMLPVLALLGLRARDVMGVTFTVFVVLAPVVLVLVTVLGADALVSALTTAPPGIGGSSCPGNLRPSCAVSVTPSQTERQP